MPEHGQKEKVMSLERDYQSYLKKKLTKMFPGCVIMKADPNDIQGIPDLIILHHDKWAALEVKRSATATHRPNQDYYVAKLDSMSFSRFIYPENEEEVLNGIQSALSPNR